MLAAAALVLLILGFFAGLGLLYYAWIEARTLRLRRFTLRFADLPAAFDGYRIVFASDFHVRRQRLIHRKLLAALGTLEGDLLILGGDFQNRRNERHDRAIAFIDALALLAPRYPDGVLAVRGNHDGAAVRAYLKQHATIRYLAPGAHVIRRGGEAIAVAGVRKSPHESAARMERQVALARAAIPGDVPFRILMAHWPEYFFPAAAAGFQLILSGDTHGGQIRLPLVGALIKKTELPQRYAWGLVQEKGATLYTTNGVGTQSFPFRLLCPPEVLVFELRRETANALAGTTETMRIGR